MSKILTQIILVFLGGGVGSILRYGISQVANSSILALGIVNILGGLGAGIVMSWYSAPNESSYRLLLMTGLMGGFTTFSAFSYEIYQLIQKSQYYGALGFLFCVFFGSLLGVYIGHKF